MLAIRHLFQHVQGRLGVLEHKLRYFLTKFSNFSPFLLFVQTNRGYLFLDLYGQLDCCASLVHIGKWIIAFFRLQYDHSSRTTSGGRIWS